MAAADLMAADKAAPATITDESAEPRRANKSLVGDAAGIDHDHHPHAGLAGQGKGIGRAALAGLKTILHRWIQRVEAGAVFRHELFHHRQIGKPRALGEIEPQIRQLHDRRDAGLQPVIGVAVTRYDDAGISRVPDRARKPTALPNRMTRAAMRAKRRIRN